VHIKPSEDRREWRKFMLQVCGIMALLSGVLVWREAIGIRAWSGLLGLLLVTALTAGIRPEWFRGFYRFGLIASAWLGERMGRVILTIFFFVLIVPLGWVLRLAGHDPLARRKPPLADSYWQPAGKTGRLDRMY
jgi:hypothetical protein